MSDLRAAVEGLARQDVVGALALGLVSYRPDDEMLASSAETIATAIADFLDGAGLVIVPADAHRCYDEAALAEAWLAGWLAYGDNESDAFQRSPDEVAESAREYAALDEVKP